MKIEVKHLTAYLPYKLKLQYIDNRVARIGIMEGINHDNGSEEPTRVCISSFGWDYIWKYKPLLRPLDKLTTDDIVKLKLFCEPDKQYLIDNPLNCGYEDLQYLLSRHFDVFGLIKANLAIDITNPTSFIIENEAKKIREGVYDFYSYTITRKGKSKSVEGKITTYEWWEATNQRGEIEFIGSSLDNTIFKIKKQITKTY